MPGEILLFRGPEFTPVGKVELAPVVRLALRPYLQVRGGNVTLSVQFLPVVDEVPSSGRPDLVNLRPELGWTEVNVELLGKVVYRHPHPVRELFEPVLREILTTLDRTVSQWGYQVIFGPEVGTGLAVDAGSFGLALSSNSGREAVRPVPFTVRPAPEPELEEYRPGVDGPPLDGDDTDPVLLVVTAPAQRLLSRDLVLSSQVEEGGFLAGRVHRLGDAAAGRYVVVVEDLLVAEHSGASLMRFTFTERSFQEMHQALADRPGGQRLLGWYHTHLFSARSPMGLSSMDVRLHRRTFRRPWQVACLLNVTRDERVIRFYARSDKEMRECPQWIDHERDGYRRQDPLLVRASPDGLAVDHSGDADLDGDGVGFDGDGFDGGGLEGDDRRAARPARRPVGRVARRVAGRPAVRGPGHGDGNPTGA